MKANCFFAFVNLRAGKRRLMYWLKNNNDVIIVQRLAALKVIRQLKN